MLKFDSILDEVFSIMRYCYRTPDPSLVMLPNVEEWSGLPGIPGVSDPEPGVKQYIRSLFWEATKKGFLAGYKAGGSAVFNDLSSSLPKERVVEFNETDSSYGAEREFLKWERE